MTTTDPITILIVDDHPVVRTGLAGMLSARRELKLVAEAANGDEALLQYARCRPDVVLMDLRMPGLDGVAAIEAIRAQDETARVVILTTFDGEEDIYRGLRAGAKAYLLKDAPDDEIVNCIAAVMRGQKYLPRGIASKLAERMSSDELSRREREVLQHLASGKSNKEIARLTGITEGTVKFHVTAVMTKLGARSRTEAVAVAIRKGLISVTA